MNQTSEPSKPATDPSEENVTRDERSTTSSFKEKIVTIAVTAAVTALVTLLYADIKDWIWRSDLTGDWVLVGNEIGERPNMHRLFQEAITLKVSGEYLSAKGIQGNYRRDYVGYDKKDYLALVYHSPDKIGIGTVLVRDRTGQRKVFVGQWTGRDCTVKKIVECPAILVRGNIGSEEVEAAKEKFAEFLSTRCRETAEATCP